MDTSLALTIIGSVLILIGIVKNVIPKQFNQLIMGDLVEEAVNPAAGMRTVIGGGFMAVGITALYCRELPTAQAVTLLTSLQIGMGVIMATIILSKVRGFIDDLPIPPLVVFSVLIAIAFYAS